MKWTLISKPANTLQEYHLTQDDKVRAVIKYNPSQQSVRINDSAEQRLLFIERRGFFWNRQTVFQNEYGVSIGKLLEENRNDNVGAIEIDGRRYQYTIQHNTQPELVIYEHDVNSPLATCKLQEATSSSFKKDMQKYTNLLLSMCWCLFYPIAGVQKAANTAVSF